MFCNHNGAKSIQMRWYGPLESLFLVNFRRTIRKITKFIQEFHIFIPWLYQQCERRCNSSGNAWILRRKGNFRLLCCQRSYGMRYRLPHIEWKLSLVDYLFKSIFHLFDLSLILQSKEWKYAIHWKTIHSTCNNCLYDPTLISKRTSEHGKAATSPLCMSSFNSIHSVF